MRRTLLVLLGLCLLPSSPALAGDEPRFELVDRSAGLSHNNVSSIAQDRRGFLWFGTAEGLNRYDGYEFTTYQHDPSDPSSLSRGTVYSMLVDRLGTLWLGTYDGLSRFRPGSEDFDRFPLQGSDDTWGSDTVVNQLAEDAGGRLWAATSKGLFLLDRASDSFARVETVGGGTIAPGSINALAIVRDLVWILAAERPKSPYGVRLQRLEPGREVVTWEAPDTWRYTHSIVADRNGRLWGAPRHSSLDTAGDPGFSVAPETGVFVWDHCEDSAGTIWFATSQGLWRVRPGGEPERVALGSAPGADSWLHDYVFAVFESSSGTLWVGTQGGLYRHDPARQPFRVLRHEPGDPNSLSSSVVSALALDSRGGLWVGTFGRGLNHVELETGFVVRYRRREGDSHSLCNDLIWSLRSSADGALWIGTEPGICRLDARRQRFEFHEIPPPAPFETRLARVNAIVDGKENRLWLATDDGLYELDTLSRQIRFRSDVDPDGLVPIVDLEAIGGVLWLGSYDGSLWRFEPASGHSEKLALFDALDSSSSILDVVLRSNEELWLATRRGLVRIDRRTHDTLQLDESRGLPSRSTYSLLEDDQGRLWAGTSRGLVRLEPLPEGGFAIRTFDTSDGIASDEFNRHAAIRLPSGEMVFGGMEGLTIFDPTEIRENRFVPPVMLTRVSTARREGSATIHPFGGERLKLSYRDYTLSFEYAALSYTNPAKNQYRYRLEGFDDDWIEAGTRRFASYTNLPAGDYVFRVLGSNNDGVWNREGASLALTVTPPWWGTWWFRLGVALAIATLLAMAYRYRVAHLIETERLRLRIASDLHDDVSSDLAGIALTIELLEGHSELPADERSHLRQARATALRLIDGLRDIVWAVNPEHDNLAAAVARMRSVASTLLEDVELDLVVAPGITDRDLAMTVRRNLFLVFKEAVHNISRHADAEVVSVSLVESSRGVVRLEIRDDGCGFDPSQDGRGDGLRNMRRRAAEIGGELDVASEIGRGTVVTLVAPMARTRDRGSANRSLRF